MTESSPGAQAVADFEIEEVFLLSSTCFVDKSFNPTEQNSDVLYAHRIGVSNDVIRQTRTPVDSKLEDIYIVRYQVKGEIYFLKKGVTPNSGMTEIADEDTLAKICLLFAADYRCSKELHERIDSIAAFGRNAVFHVWPFWREGVHEITSRMHLPRVTIPMLKPKPRDTDYHVTVQPVVQAGN